MPAITLSMKVFDNVRSQMTQAMVDNINKSPTFVQQLSDYNADVVADKASPIAFSSSINKTGSFFTVVGNKYAILLDSNDNWATGKNYSYQDGSGVFHTINTDGEFGGVLAHELGHYKSISADAAMNSSISFTDPGYALNATSFAMYQEGEGAYNNWLIRKETAAAGGSEVEVRGSNYQFGSTTMNNIWSNMAATMDSISASAQASGQSAADTKIALTETAGSYIANQNNSVTNERYWDYYMRQVKPTPAPTPTTQVDLIDTNHDGKFELVIETKTNGTQEIAVNTSGSFAALPGTIYDVATEATLSATGSGITVNAGPGANITLGGNGNFSSDADLDVVNFNGYGFGGTVTISSHSRANIFENGLTNTTVYTSPDIEVGVYGNGPAIVHGAGPTAAIWAGNGTGVRPNASPPIQVLDLNGGTLTVVDNSMVGYGNSDSNSLIYIGSNSYVRSSNGGYETIYMNGTHSQFENVSVGSRIYANGDHNIIELRGTNATVYNSGPYNYVNNYGHYDHVYQYGSYEYVWTNDPTLTIYNSNSTDTSLGAAADEYWIFFGFGGNKDSVKSEINGGASAAIGELANPFMKDAAQRGIDELQQILQTDTHSNPTGARWDHTTITWSLGEIGKNFSGAIAPELQHYVKEAFATWEKATGLHFQEVGGGLAADVNLGWSDLSTNTSNVLGLTSFATDSNGHMQSGSLIQLEDPTETALIKEKGNNLIYQGTSASLEQVLLHEIGHILGLGANTDPTSIENFYLGLDNRSISAEDIEAIYSIYPELGHTPATLIGPSWNASGIAQVHSVAP